MSGFVDGLCPVLKSPVLNGRQSSMTSLQGSENGSGGLPSSPFRKALSGHIMARTPGQSSPSSKSIMKQKSPSPRIQNGSFKQTSNSKTTMSHSKKQSTLTPKMPYKQDSPATSIPEMSPFRQALSSKITCSNQGSQSPRKQCTQEKQSPRIHPNSESSIQLTNSPEKKQNEGIKPSYFGQMKVDKTRQELELSPQNCLENSPKGNGTFGGLTEDDVIDCLFFSCGGGLQQSVPTSRLLDYLQCSIVDNYETRSLLKNLALTFDPEGVDVEIDLKTYRCCIQNWIQKIKQSNHESDDEIPEDPLPGPTSHTYSTKPTLQMCGLQAQGPHMQGSQALGSHKAFHKHSENNFGRDVEHHMPESMDVYPEHHYGEEGDLSQEYTVGSLEASGGQNSQSEHVDVIALTGQVEELQHQNKNLCEENRQLETQLDAAEDTVQQLYRETEQLNKKLQSQAALSERLKQLQCENEELKSTIMTLELSKKALEKTVNKLHYENSNLENHKSLLEEKVLQIKGELDEAHSQQQELQTSLCQKKHECIKVQSLSDLHEAQLTQKSTKLDELLSLLNELTRANEVLKTEKTELHNELVEVRRTVASLEERQRCATPLLDSTDDDIMPIKLAPTASSTPFRQPASLGSELRDQIMVDDTDLPSPLCEKPFELRPPSFNNEYFAECVAERDWQAEEDEIAALLQQKTTGMKDGIENITSQFNKKKEFVLEQIQQLSTFRPNSPVLSSRLPSNIPRSPRFPSNLPRSPRLPSNLASSPRLLNNPSKSPHPSPKMTISGNIGKSPLSSPLHKGIKKLQVGGAKIESGSGKLPVGVKSVNQDVAPSPKVVQQRLKEELEGFAVQVAALDRAKQMSDRRAEKLANVVRRLKDRNETQRLEHEASIRKLEETFDFDNSIEQRLGSLATQLEAERKYVTDLENKLQSISKDLRVSQDKYNSISKAYTDLQYQYRKMEVEHSDLKRSNTELTEQCTKVKGDMSDVQEELIKSKEVIAQEKKKAEQLESLHTMCMENESVQIYQRLQYHMEVLAQSTNRMSSRAEVLESVHQERRLSSAIEVMVQHTENLKRLYEREHHELEETRRILQENNLYTPSTSPDIAGECTIGKRSMSVTEGATSLKETRRRASVAVGALGRQASVSNDPKSQSIVASTSAGNKNSIFSVVRRASMADKGDSSPTGQSELSPILSSPTLEKTQELNPNDIKESLQPVVVSNGSTSASIDTISSSTLASPTSQGTTLVRRSVTYSKDGSDKSIDHKANCNEEEIFQKGYEEGIKAKVSQDLEDLREQQKVFCDTLEDLMDQSEIAEQMEACESRETSIEKVSKIKPRHELINSKFSWDKSGKQMRFLLACILFGIAVLTVLFTLMTGGPASNTDTSVEEMLRPHISVRHYRAPPS
ncbi:unnamed protein product [Owenia fusiformis]|uniref:KASH5-like coiled-coil domain-containing protein n=1 Tax=Owenia fusiformis TaxID=6347 RepID=A0A8S4Q2R2_OWEFU|nr:unnamed protein product [Owenia fusiformis]